MKKILYGLLLLILIFTIYNTTNAIQCGAGYKILHLSEEEKNNENPINFPNTYKHFEYKSLANDSKDKSIFEYIGASSREEWGSGECDQLSYNFSIALIEVFKQIHYDTITIIEPSEVYEYNGVNRIIVSDLGGCTDAHAKNFHASYKYTDFVYLNTTPNPYLRNQLYDGQLGDRRRGNSYEEIYNIVYNYDKTKLNEKKFDRLRQALFWKYLQDLRLGGGLVGSQIVDFVQEKLNCIDCSIKEEELLKKLGLYKYNIEINKDGKKVIVKNDQRGHPTHMHTRFYTPNWNEFKKTYWYFYDEEYCRYYNERETDINKDNCELIGGQIYTGKDGSKWCYSIDSETILGHKTDNCIDSKKVGKGGSPFFTKVQNTNKNKSNDIWSWTKCFTDRWVWTDGDHFESSCKEGTIAPWLDKSNQQPIGNFESLKCNNGIINLVGRTYDPDDTEQSIDINIYQEIGTIDSIIGSCEANILRNDVNKNLSISGNHGFNCNINTINDGNYNISIKAIDSTSDKIYAIEPTYKYIKCGKNNTTNTINNKNNSAFYNSNNNGLFINDSENFNTYDDIFSLINKNIGIEEITNDEKNINNESIIIKPSIIAFLSNKTNYKTTIYNKHNNDIYLNFDSNEDIKINPNKFKINKGQDIELDIVVSNFNKLENNISGSFYSDSDMTESQGEIIILLKHKSVSTYNSKLKPVLQKADDIISDWKNRFGDNSEIYDKIIKILKTKQLKIENSDNNKSNKSYKITILDYLIIKINEIGSD